MGVPVIPCVEQRQALTNLLESIALEETALAHVVNAEGEKIQAFVHMPGVTPAQLLAVNASVQGTVDAVTRLTMVLQSKLALFSGMIQA